MILLALDLSKRSTGYAVDGAEAACPPRAGAWRSPGGGQIIGRIGHKYQQWLWAVIAQWGVERIAYEAPAVGASGGKANGKSFVMNEETVIPLIGLAFATETIAYAAGIPVSREHVATVRRHFVNHGQPSDPKKKVRARCNQLGWPVPNYDAADAAALWAYAKATYDKSFRLEAATPLFGKVA